MKRVNCGIKFRSAKDASNYAFLQRSALYPITHDSVEVMNAMANQRSMKRQVFLSMRMLTEF